MKIHTTNYHNTFILVSDDCPTTQGEVPPLKMDAKSVAYMQFEKIMEHPYKYTSDEVMFQVFAERNDVSGSEMEESKAHFFSKGQACFRASPLPKRYGWGVHSDSEGKLALYGKETAEYEQFMNDPTVAKVKAMKSAKK